MSGHRHIKASLAVLRSLCTVTEWQGPLLSVSRRPIPRKRLAGAASHIRAIVALATTMTVLVLAAGVSVAGAAQSCPNEAVRVQQGSASLALPDCRAYEMVSPWGSVPEHSPAAQAAKNGERFHYKSLIPYPNAEGESMDLLSTRTAQGWSTKGMTPPQGGVETSPAFACSPSVFYSADLTLSLLTDGWQGEESTFCEGDVPALVPGEPRGFANVFLHEENGKYTLLDMPPEGVAPANAIMQDATPDLSHVIFSEEAQLTMAAPSQLYEWTQGSLYPVAVLPNGAPVLGTLANGGGSEEKIGGSRLQNEAAYFTHAMSADGERVFFYAEGKLYVRLNAAQEPTLGGECSAAEPTMACTVEVDAAESGVTGHGGGGVFVDASADGSRVFFTDEKRLTANATAVANKPDLYEYDVETGVLTDLTASAIEPADVRGFSGASEDGAYIYFVALGVLTGAQQNGMGATAISGEPNLYVYHADVTTFIATLKPEVNNRENDSLDWQEGNDLNTGYLRTAVSPNGLFIAFSSDNRLTGYDNEPVEAEQCSGNACSEIFLYGVRESGLRCVSCVANGERPIGSAEIRLPQDLQHYVGAPKIVTHPLDNSGRLFFEAPGALLPAVTDGAMNVYEYEDGELSLISSGTAQGGSRFLDASTSGNDVFFATGQSLVQADTDNQLSVYDARVNGGFMAQSSSGEGGGAGACEDVEACRPPLGEPPVEAFPASAAFSGPGDLPVVPEGPSSKKGQQPRSLTRSERLARALAVCSKKPKRKQRSCRARARRRFGAHPAQRKSGARHRHTTSKHRTNRRAGR